MVDSDPPKPKLRWYQFRLRTLLIVMTVLAVWIGLKADRANRQKRAVEAITQMGAQFCYDYQAEPSATRGFQHNYKQEPPGPEWLRQVVGDDYFMTAIVLVVENQRVVDEGGLALLDKLPDLEAVHFSPTTMKLRDSDLAHLKHVTKLRSLTFGGVALSGDDGPRHFDFLSNCRRLEVLDANNSQFGDAALAHLRGARNLRSLLLSKTLVGDDGLTHLKRLTSLEMLELSKTKVTDAGLPHLRSLRALTYLGLNDNNVTDAGMEYLKGLTSLRRLGLSGTRVTEEGVKGLQSALPKCRIEHHPRPSPSSPTPGEDGSGR